MELLAFLINPFGLINIISLIVCYKMYQKTGSTLMLLFSVLNVVLTLYIIFVQVPVFLTIVQ